MAMQVFLEMLARKMIRLLRWTTRVMESWENIYVDTVTVEEQRTHW
jgi:hypothetical protein